MVYFVLLILETRSLGKISRRQAEVEFGIEYPYSKDGMVKGATGQWGWGWGAVRRHSILDSDKIRKTML